jgi:hypothetical protein
MNRPDQQTIVWQPQRRQAAFISCPCDDVGFGGARGGGKSDAVIGDWISHSDSYGKHAAGMAFRRERTQLIDLVERAKQILVPIGHKWQDKESTFRGPKGSRLRFAFLESDSDADAYQGHSYTRLYGEELGTFPSETPILKLNATLRSGQGVPCQFKATFNPGGAGHQWVKNRYHLDTCPEGMQVFKVSFKTGGKTVEKTRIFIPSNVTDNQYLDENYVANLMMVGSPELVRAWLEGDWNIVQGAYFSEFEHDKHIVKPFAIPEGWTRIRAMDWGSAAPFAVLWCAIAGDDHETRFGNTIPRGAMIVYREWYGASGPNKGLKLPSEDVARGIVEREGEAINYSVIDPSCYASDGGPSIAERMARATEGAVWFRRADNRRVGVRGAMGGWDQLRARLRGTDGRPMLYIFSTCKDLIRTLPALQHDPNRPEDVDTEGEDHAPDALRYACMSRPYILDNEQPKTEAQIIAGMCKPRTLNEVYAQFVEEKYGGEYDEELHGPLELN